MNLIEGRNVHEILPHALDLLFQRGVRRETRNGPALQLPGPSLIAYEHPWERVLFWPERDANPFFHLYESLWMLAGRNEVAPLTNYVKNMLRFSDDGKVFNGAYGYRWRKFFHVNQLDEIIKALRVNPNCRRQVLSMWSTSDLERNSVDKPCNTHAYVTINNLGSLDLTVCNRSNDLVWGALGANAVHFSFLQEYLAAHIGVPVGTYYQFTNNLHGYLATAEPLRDLVKKAGEASPYEVLNFRPLPLGVVTDEQLFLFLSGHRETGNPFLDKVASPMRAAHEYFRDKDWDGAFMECGVISSPDWRMACYDWLRRRQIKHLRAQDDGVAHE